MPSPLGSYGPSGSFTEALARAAELFGVQSSFHDIWGKQHVTTVEVKEAILRSLGVDTLSTASIDAAIHARLKEETALLPPTLVLLASDARFPLTVPTYLAMSEASAAITFENGQSRHLTFQLASAEPQQRFEFDGESYIRFELSLPRDLPLGYHKFTLALEGLHASSHLILAPGRAYLPLSLGRKYAGIAISLYGLRSRRNWGAGDFTDLERFTDWMASHTSAEFVALNPLHAIANRTPYNTSPYLPQCAFYRNFLYLDMERVPELKHSAAGQRMLASPGFQAKLEALRSSEFCSGRWRQWSRCAHRSAPCRSSRMPHSRSAPRA